MDQSVEITKRVLEEIVSERSLNVVGVRLWDGTDWPDDRPRPVTIVLNHPGALRRMFLPGIEIGLAEAYLFDDFDIEGDIESLFRLAERCRVEVRDVESLREHYAITLRRRVRRLEANRGLD